jgi:transgelin
MLICYRLMNLAVGPGTVRYKTSSMPFVQMENISHFLRVCQLPPISLQPHDVFLTVDLYESKDPAQVLQCIDAFSRAAHAVNPARFPRTVGGRISATITPQGTGQSGKASGGLSRARGVSNTSQGSNTARNGSLGTSGRASPTKTVGTVSPEGVASSWSKKTDVGKTMPAWNIAQYGWTGGASQGNQGISFGSRRQITAPAPHVPSLAEKERKRREQEEEAERSRIQAEEAEHKRRVEREAEEERERAAEERRREEISRERRERERREAEDERRRWEDEERRWKEEEEARAREERDALARIEKERQRKRTEGDGRLRGQFLSQYQAEQGIPSPQGPGGNGASAESTRIRDLERQLEEAKERERQYEKERQERMRSEPAQPAPSVEPAVGSDQAEEAGKKSWEASERDFLRHEWSNLQSQANPESEAPPVQPPRPLPVPGPRPTANARIPSPEKPLSPFSRTVGEPPTSPSRPPYTSESEDKAPSLPTRTSYASRANDPPPPSPPTRHPYSSEAAEPPGPSHPTRPLPDPQVRSPHQPLPSRTERFLSSNPAPLPSSPSQHLPEEALHSTSAEQGAETARRLASQQKTKAGGWASKSLLEREMERERERQREWEDAQKDTQEAVARGVRDGGSGPGESWDVNQYGYIGGDNLNRPGGVYAGRRQIMGPRPLGSKPP